MSTVKEWLDYAKFWGVKVYFTGSRVHLLSDGHDYDLGPFKV